MRLIDTVGLKRRKEGYEQQLKEIEEDIKKLNKAYIFVEWFNFVKLSRSFSYLNVWNLVSHY